MGTVRTRLVVETIFSTNRRAVRDSVNCLSQSLVARIQSADHGGGRISRWADGSRLGEIQRQVEGSDCSGEPSARSEGALRTIGHAYCRIKPVAPRECRRAWIIVSGAANCEYQCPPQREPPLNECSREKRGNECD